MNDKCNVIVKGVITSVFAVILFFSISACSGSDKNIIDPRPPVVEEELPDDKEKPPAIELPFSAVSVLPRPTSLELGEYNIAIPQDASVSKSINGVGAQLLTETLDKFIGRVGRAENERAFIRIYSDDTLEEEGYRITVGDGGISVYYKTEAGLLWGIQTMRQILLQNTVADGRRTIPVLTLSDAPKKEWRGFHIDVARHMFTTNFLKKLVDCLSFYKINKLQIHLTDDQGWRIVIDKYPELIEIGAWREFDEYDRRCIAQSKSDASFALDSRFLKGADQYGGFYTKAELLDLVNYAADRGIDVIPEIDMPGHFSAAIRAFPNLSCTGSAGWGDEFSYPVCAGKTQNYPFFKDILDEVATLFPSTYFHIGADEVEKDNWMTCKDCQGLITEKGLRNVDGLQNYFVKEMGNYLRSNHNKMVMAWDDAFIERDPQEFLYTYWRPWISQNPARITQNDFSMVFMEWDHFYFSATPSDRLLKNLYEFELEPKFKGIVDNKLVGFQACVWTEMIPNETKFGHHVFPSLQAFSELAWGSERDWDSFVERLPWHLDWLEQAGFATRTPGFL